MQDQKARYDLRLIAHQAMIDRGLEPDFPREALQQLAGIAGPARQTENSIRDLRDLLWCSIDNDTSMDLDQLTVAEKLPMGLVKVLVAIADVDALVKPASPIDRHAKTNTTSVYTDAQIFAMLPEKLSTNLTSLAEGEDRLALVIEMVVATDGSIKEFDVYRALVRNQAKLAYNGIAAWLDGKDKMPEKIAKTNGLDEQLRMQDQIAQVMKSVRHLHGALDLETIEPEAVLKDGEVVDLRLERKNRAKELIEDFMIAANGVTAQFLDKHGIPALRRVVRTPERWDRIRQVAAECADQLPAVPDSKALAAFLGRRRQLDPLHFPDLSLTVIKLLGSGEYVVQLSGQESAGHFGLAVQKYSHSTAPIHIPARAVDTNRPKRQLRRSESAVNASVILRVARMKYAHARKIEHDSKRIGNLPARHRHLVTCKDRRELDFSQFDGLPPAERNDLGPWNSP